jgi:GntR family transcriptional regulator
MATSIESNGAILRDARTRYTTAQREENGARGAFDAELQRTGRAPRSEVSVRRAAAPADVAELLGADGEVVIRAREMFDGDRIVQLATTYIPIDVAEAAGVEQVDTGVGGIISRMKEAGFDQGDAANEDVSLRAATADEAARLGLPGGSDVLTINHVGRTTEGRVVEVTQHVLGKNWTLRFSVPLV